MTTPPHTAARKTHVRFRALLPAMVLLVFLPVIVRATGFSYTTATGIGADAQIHASVWDAAAAGTNYGSDPYPTTTFYTAAHGSGGIWSRKAYLRFNTTGLTGIVTGASLTLDFLMVGSPSVLNVFGLKDSVAGQNWGESAITWNTAPANDIASEGGIYTTPGTGGTTADAVFLGTCTVNGNGYATFSGAALVPFLNADTDHLVTLILTPQTADVNVQFYAKEIGVPASYPTLNVTVTPLPDPTAWVSNYGAVGTATAVMGGGLNVTSQTGSPSARDVSRLFVAAVPGCNLRMLATGSNGAVVDYFDETRNNGLYAIYGSTTPGTVTVTLQRQPTSGGDWVTQDAFNVTVGAARVLNHDTDVDISSWYMCPPPYDCSAISSAQFSAMLDTDFATMQAKGFTKVSEVWQPVLYPAVLFSKASQYDLKVMYFCWRTHEYIKSTVLDDYSHNQPILEMENTLIGDGIASDVGNGVLMKNHPNLGTYYLADEPAAASARTLELAAMMAKSLDPHHTGAATFAGPTDDVLELVAATPFLDMQMFDPYPLGNTNPQNRAGSNPSPASDFSRHYPFTNTTWHPAMTWADYLQWTQSLRPGVPVEILFQAFGSDPVTYYFRDPSPKEVRAQAFMALARGARCLTYFIYNSGAGFEGLIDVNGNATAKMTEAQAINAKVAGWRPIYERLTVSNSGLSGAYIPYSTIAATMDTFYYNGFEEGDGFDGSLVATQAFSPHGGSWCGYASAATGCASLMESTEINWVRFPRYSSAAISGWVNDNNNPTMTYRFGAAFYGLGGTWNNNDGTYAAIGSGWNYLTTDLSANVSNPNTLSTPIIFAGVGYASAYADHYVDDVTVTATTAAYRPNYQYQGGVVGNFIHKDTGRQYIIVVNTDTVNTRNVSVKVTDMNGLAATAVQDVDSGAVYGLSSGLLTLGIAPGDGRLLSVIPVFVNSGFEAPLTGTYVYRPAGGGWTFAGNSGIQHNGSAWGAATAPEGVQTAFLQGSGSLGSIAQSVAFPAGTYKLSFYAARRSGQIQPIRVSVDGTTVGTYTPASNSFGLITTAAFTVTAGNHTITLSATASSGDKSSFVDKVTAAVSN